MDSDPTMSKEDYLEDRRRAIKESIEYFSAKNKAERERWVCHKFIENLGITFDKSEIISSSDDPPDVFFRDTRFEVKEILDPGRRRHDEYKAAHKKALEASDPQDLLEPFTLLEDITPLQIADRILPELKALDDHYAPAVRAELDLLFYVNLLDHFLKAGPMPTTTTFAPFGWRSVSAVVMGGEAIVFFAVPNAPSFLYSKVGTLTQGSAEGNT